MRARTLFSLLIVLAGLPARAQDGGPAPPAEDGIVAAPPDDGDTPPAEDGIVAAPPDDGQDPPREDREEDALPEPPDDEGDDEKDRAPEVRLEDGAFEVLLPVPVKDSSTALLWIAAGRRSGDGARPVPRERAHDVDLAPCPGVADARCARVTGLEDLTLEPGRFTAKLHVDGHGHALVVYVPPDARMLWGWLVAGLLVSFGLSTLGQRIVERLHRRRRLNRLEARVHATREDHPPLLARIRALLELVSLGLRRPVFGADPEALDRYLDEAMQLLSLAESKTRVWHRMRGLQVSPSLAAQINAELRLFDLEILQLDLPLSEEAFSALQIPSLVRASELLDGAGPRYAEDVGGALADALLPRVEAPASDDADPVGRALSDQIAQESARLQQIADRGDARSPAQLREADLRLAVVLACREVQDGGAAARENLDPAAIEQAIAAWRSVHDLNDGATERAHEALMAALRWQPETQRFHRWLQGFVTGGRLEIAAEPDWQTFTPYPVRVEARAPSASRYAEGYAWRRLLSVVWRAETAEGQPTTHVRIMGEPGPGGDGVRVKGPETSVYCTRAGRYRLTATLVGPDGAPLCSLLPRSLTLLPGPEQRASAIVGFLSDVRLSLKLLATLVAGLVLMESAAADPHGVSTYAAVFYSMVGAAVDLGTTAVPRALDVTFAAARRLFAGRPSGDVG